jgi:hypothetical protein
MTTFTQRQGQFLAFIHLYRLLHKRGQPNWTWSSSSA